MAEPKGILAMLGAREPDEDEGGDADDGEMSPKARAMQEMAEAQEAGDWEAMGHAYERAYKICKARASGPAKSEAEPAEDSGEDDY